MSLTDLLDQLRFDTRFMRNVAAWERIPAQAPRYAEFPDALAPSLVDLTRQSGYAPLYIHQARAIDSALSGQNVVLVTGTASGKSLAYHLFTLQTRLDDPRATALYIFPTKALAQDQAAGLTELLDVLTPSEPTTRIPVNVYDGDTPSGRRTRIRREGGIVITNPDMLHVGILPYHPRWADFFSHLQVVVLDEMHIYRGVFGSHMANVIRRLRRICAFYGSSPIFIMTSATIANPDELAQRLIGAPVTVIDEDGSPRGEKHIILYNPPTIDERLGVRRSYILETRSIAGEFLAENVQTIVFTRARLTTEVLLGYLRDELEQQGHSPASIRGYRGGYLPLERRAIEQGLRDGSVHGVVATNALELGVDIGALGAAVLAGYPGTLASTWQQFGRAGRRADVSVGVLVASGAPLDQYIVNHPRYLFERPPEHALINPDNLAILIDHLRCALYELPFVQGESFGMFDDAGEVLSLLAEENRDIHPSSGGFHWVSDTYPAAEVNLRTGTGDRIIIQDQSGEKLVVIGEVDRQSAPIMVHVGAVYMHEGQQYLVEELDWANGLALARRAEVEYYTDAGTGTDIKIEEEQETAVVGDCVKAYGRVLVTQQAVGYRIVRRYTHETLGYGEIDLPPQEFETSAYWITLTPDLTARLEDEQILLRPINYGPNWAKQRDKARARDGYRCTNCGAPEQPDRQHDVHHVRPFREFNYVPGQNNAYQEANRLDNLVTLCRRCHRAVEGSQGKKSALGGLVNVLHNAATLLLICSPKDIGVLAEQRSPVARLPTITIYDQAPGGLGLSDRLYDLHEVFLSRALELTRDCPCQEGCPACVGPVVEVGADTKTQTLALLRALNGEGI